MKRVRSKERLEARRPGVPGMLPRRGSRADASPGVLPGGGGAELVMTIQTNAVTANSVRAKGYAANVRLLPRGRVKLVRRGGADGTRRFRDNPACE
ncbi:hypothetical protein GCM10027360_57060 [Amycolatopsis echigonensis]